MMRSTLAVLGHQRLFAVEPAAPVRQMAPIAHPQREHAKTLARETADLELDDVPAEPAIGDAARRGRILAKLALAPMRERRQLDAVPVAHLKHRLDARVDERPLQTPFLP